MKNQEPTRASSRELVGELREYLRSVAAENNQSPSEKELGERFRAGKSAIRDALIRLESHGFIRRRHGARLDINRYALRSSDSYTFRQEFTGEVEMLEVRPVILDAATAEVLQTDAQTPAMYLVRLLMEAGVPVALGRTTVPLEALPTPDFDEAAAPRDVAAQLLGEEVVWLNVHPTASSIDAEDAALLNIEEGAPVLEYEIIGLNAGGRPMYFLKLKSVPERRDWVLTYTLG